MNCGGWRRRRPGDVADWWRRESICGLLLMHEKPRLTSHSLHVCCGEVQAMRRSSTSLSRRASATMMAELKQFSIHITSRLYTAPANHCRKFHPGLITRRSSLRPPCLLRSVIASLEKVSSISVCSIAVTRVNLGTVANYCMEFHRQAPTLEWEENQRRQKERAIEKKGRKVSAATNPWATVISQHYQQSKNISLRLLRKWSTNTESEMQQSWANCAQRGTFYSTSSRLLLHHANSPAARFTGLGTTTTTTGAGSIKTQPGMT